MAINTIDFSNWPDWDDINWQECICISPSRIRDGKDQRDLTSIEINIRSLREEGICTYYASG